MADVLQDLTIVIGSEADGAVSEIDKLSAKLTSLANVVKTTKSGVGSFSKNYTSMLNSIKSTSSLDGASIEKLNNLIMSMKQLDGFKMSGAPGTQIEKLLNGIKVMQGEDFSFTSLDTLMDKLSGLSEIKLSKSVGTNLKNIADFSQQLNGYDFTKLGELTDALSKLGSVSNVDSKAMRDLASSVKTYTSATSTSAKRSRTFNTVLANIKTTTLALIGVAKKVSGLVEDSIDKYGDYIETMNLFSVSMGKAGKSAYDFAIQAQDLLGIDLTQWMKAQGVFMSLGKGFGIAEDKAATMSQQLTQLAYDISSFYNISVEDAIQKVQSAFSGELEPVRRLGYDLSQARLQAIALSYGIEENVSSMTQAEKASLRYVAMLTQVTDVQGDLARTIESPTNQLRVLNAQVDQMKRSIGMSLIPMLNKILPYLNATFRVIKMIADEIAGLFGYTLPTISESDFDTPVVSGLDGIEDSAESATEATEKLKNTLASFDQINLIGSSSSSGGGSGSGSGNTSGVGFDIDVPTYDFLGDATGGRAKQIAEDMMRDLRPVIDLVEGAIKWTIENLDVIETGLATLATVTLAKKLVGSIKDAKEVFGSFSKDVLGLSLVTIGVSLSYSGGKDLGSGDTLGGFIKSALGVAAAGVGGFLIAGPAGAVIGIGVAIVADIIGYVEGDYESMIQEVKDIAFAYDDARISVEEFETGWNNFISGFNKPEYDISGITGIETSIEGISGSISDLHASYIAGQIDTATYVLGVDAQFAMLEQTVKKHTDAASQMIREALSGEIGDFLQLMGVSVEELDKSLDTADANISAEIENIRSEMAGLNQQLLDGMNYDEYSEKMQPLIEKLDALGVSIDFSSEQTETFFSTISNTPVNFDSYEQAIEEVNKVNSAYDETVDAITAYRDKLTGELERKIPFMSEEEKKNAEAALSFLEIYFDQQLDTVNKGYEQTLQTIEESAYIDWDKAYDVKGFGKTYAALGEDIVSLSEVINASYGERGLEKPINNFHKLTDALKAYSIEDEKVRSNDYDEDEEIAFYTNMENYVAIVDALGRADRDLYADSEALQSALKNAEGSYAETYNGIASIVSGSNSKLNTLVGEASKKRKQIAEDEQISINDTTDYAAFHRYETTVKSMSDMNSVVRNGMRDVVNTFSDPQDEVVKALKGAMSGGIGAVSGSNVDFKNSTKDIMTEMSKVLKDPDRMLVSSLDTTYKNLQKINPNDWKNVGKQITTGIKDGINGVSLTDAITNLEKPFAGIVAEIVPKKLGNDIATGIKGGMDDKRLDVNNSANQMVLNIANPIKMFGGSAYDYFIDMASGISAILNGIKGGTGASATSVFTTGFKNVFKKWTLKGFASGGFVDSADFFYANENGVPEYIGSMGGRTAVANNQEITAGISDAVYKAIKDTGIGRDVAKIASKSGNVVFSPSEGAGRVVAQSIDMYNRTGGRY